MGLLHDNLRGFFLKHFAVKTLEVESEVLKGNPLGDSSRRLVPVLLPHDVEEGEALPLVLILAGFTGNGPKYFNVKGYEENFPQVLDRSFSRGEAPRAVFAFVDGWSYWGGSQFINSAGTGRYEDFIVKELLSDLRDQLPVSDQASLTCVTGGSSGGYGSLHLVSQHPEQFGLAAAIAPDSFFEASLLPDIYTALPILKKVGGIAGVKEELEQGKFLRRRESHSVLNAIGMGFCYCPDEQGGVRFPVDPDTGLLNQDVWNQWLKHDSVRFLQERKDRLAKIQSIYLDVGDRDQFHLQYGTRQVRNVLKAAGVDVVYSEFSGNHFDIGERRPQVWKWLKQQWS